MPKWEEHFKAKPDSRKIQKHLSDSTPVKTSKELRDTFYDLLSKEKDSKNCNPSTGWCYSYLFERGWYKTDSDY